MSPFRYRGPSDHARKKRSGLGRILRPKKGDNKAYFYTIITSNSVEEKFAHNRQLFLTEQGYTYIILNEEMFQEKFNNPLALTPAVCPGDLRLFADGGKISHQIVIAQIKELDAHRGPVPGSKHPPPEDVSPCRFSML